ncbi:XrtA/PEP-CTERM system amidotransferase [Pseudoduganella sp. GCM10020061]|uniref:XrtA/PEP-CTERM system amidotransferase n=1 Tax=Pseudoduganella sp. GCM10020061 TaxID=3317345 RepID=UPI003637781E
MCGIAGLFDTRGRRQVDRVLLAAMNGTLSHRGPDEDDIWTAPGVGLAHRRLSVIDIASGRQPLGNEDGSVMVCYNGEIYNYRELGKELRALGHVFRTRSDTEVIVHAWEEWGEACVTRLRGMFAFALHDARRGQLFLARDRLGVKPLFYAMLPDGTLAFGSELKALRAIPWLPRTIDVQAVEEYFAYGYVPDPRTIYSGAFKLAPGHTLLLQEGAAPAAPRPYWDVRFELGRAQPEQQVQEELAARLREAVRMRLVAEVPLGAFLSGGVDSSAVVAMMAGLTDGPVNTCSVGFEHRDFDESAYAREVATRYGTAHYSRTVDPDDYGLLDTLAALYDEPYADSSAIPTYRVCELARTRVTVALSGDGGDENLAGYRRYRHAVAEQNVRGCFPAALRGPVFGALGRWYPKADWAPRVFRAKTTFEALSRDLVEGYFHGVSLMTDAMRAQLFSASLRCQLQDYHAIEVMRRHLRGAQVHDALSTIQYLDLKTYLPGDILTKVDRASMAHALEVRVPLLDHELVEWTATLPSHLKLRSGEGKYIFKKALEPYLPRHILYRKKQGFAVPLAQWFRGPLRERVRESLLGPRLADTGFFNKKYLHEIVEQHQAGRRDYSAPIWSLLVFDAFLRRESGA